MAVSGRKRPIKTEVFCQSEGPLSGKADIQELAAPKSIWNVRFTPGSGHSGNIVVNDRLRPKADVREMLQTVAELAGLSLTRLCLSMRYSTIAA